MADSVLANLITQLGGLAYAEYKMLRDVEDELKSLAKELRFMKEFLRNSADKQRKHRELVNQINEVAFEAEDVIETFLLYVERQNQRTKLGKLRHYGKQKGKLYGVAKQIQGIKTSIEKIYANENKYGIEKGDGSIDPHFVAALERRREEVDEEMVGFNDAADSLLSQLAEGSTDQLEIISIVGMGGLGKTTLAKWLYNHKIIQDHFRYRVWVTVSENYDTRQVILTILKKMGHQPTDELKKKETNELKDMLKTELMMMTEYKYIIILDDVWQTDMWDEVRACFPENKNGARILITTRNTTVARHASPNKEPHFLRFLEPGESWELFEKKIFRRDLCPPHLEPLGKEIVQRCKGLPLSIVVIASMLAGQELSERIWKRTLKDVSAHLEKDEVCLEILALSYHSLPVELKPCFLYLAAFPEDYEMNVRMLIALWVAEGFIQPVLGELIMLEEVAELYLDTLIDRSLVQAGTKRTIDGGLKTCRIHDLIRDLCIREAKREKFMLTVASELNAPTSSWVVNKSKPRRLSVHYNIEDILSKDFVPSSIRSILSFDTRGRSKYLTSEFWKKLYTEYNLLRVLDLGAGIEADNVPDNMDKLGNLRFLRLSLTKEIPESIFKLRNLQVFIITNSESVMIPTRALLNLQSIQRLELGRAWLDDTVSEALLRKKRLNNLQVLSSIILDSDFEDAITNGLCPNLRKLSMDCTGRFEWSLEKYFANLASLQSLRIYDSDSNSVGYDVFKGIKVAELPSNLMKITLNNSQWCNKSLIMLGKFPNLQVLKLIIMEKRKVWPPDHEENDCLTLREGLFPALHTLHFIDFKKYELALPPCSAENNLPNTLGQLRSLFIERCDGTSFDRNLFKLPSLKDVQVMWPDDELTTCLAELKQNNEINYRLLILQ